MAGPACRGDEREQRGWLVCLPAWNVELGMAVIINPTPTSLFGGVTARIVVGVACAAILRVIPLCSSCGSGRRTAELSLPGLAGPRFSQSGGVHRRRCPPRT
jgi:hypothetical protein